MRTFTVAERRARLARRHHLAPEAKLDDVAGIARGVVALHATDPATVFLSAAARMRDPQVSTIERALYEERSVVRMLGMRRTMFVVPTELVPVVQAGATHAIAARERVRTVRMLEGAGIPNAGTWLKDLEDATLQALEARGEAVTADLSKAVAGLGGRILAGQGTKWETEIGVSTRVMFLLAADGRIVRGRPRGSWISSQYRWAPAGAWLGDGIREISTAAARADLVCRWLQAFGPGTVPDIKWWTGWTLGETRRALADLDTADVDLEGTPGVVLPSDLEDEPSASPWVALLPALDPTVMGWTGRAWYLGPHATALFDRSGNPGPTVWVDGRIVGGWAQRRDGEIAYRLLEDVGRGANATIAAEAARLAAWHGDVRVTPRFRTPLERELVA